MSFRKRDLTLFRVEAMGKKECAPCRLKIEMVDRYHNAVSFTSTARTTAVTAAIVARMIARGSLRAKGGVHAGTGHRRPAAR